MTTPPANPLDSLEARFRDWLAHESPGAAAELVTAVRDTIGQGKLSAELPSLQAEVHSPSAAELIELMHAAGIGTELTATKPPASAGLLHVRAGYALYTTPEPAGSGVAPGQGDARVAPALAQALAICTLSPTAATDLAQRFADLWGIDVAVWRRLSTGADPAALRSMVRMWLESPGRRLVRDLDALHALGRGTALGATATNLAALTASAGIDSMPGCSGQAVPADTVRRFFADAPPRWRDAHAALPGLCLTLWQPHDGRMVTAFRRLEHGSPVTLRGAAIAWLLGRAASSPHYDIDHIPRDLRDDLPARLAAAFDPEAPANRGTAADLETVLLHHAAHMADPDGSRADNPATTLTAWGLARWLHRCVTRSHFHGGDEETLAARLRARLPRLRPYQGREPLHPLRIGRDGLDLSELALIGGVFAHYAGSGPHLDLVPQPLIDALRRIALRPLRPMEHEAEACMPAEARSPDSLGTPANALGWMAPHIAPPWAARRFLTERRLPWLGKAQDPAVTDECLAHLQAEPAKYRWLAFAVYTDGPELGGEPRRRAAAAWRFLADAAALPAHALASMAAGVLAELGADDRERALTLAASAEAEWRPFILDAYAERAARAGFAEAWSAAIEALLAAVEDPSRAVPERLSSALMALRRSADAPANERARVLARLGLAAGAPPFRDHRALQRELRRQGVSVVSSGG